MKPKEDKAKLKRTKRHYCAERKCSECQFKNCNAYECCESERNLEKRISEQEAHNE